MDPSLYQQIIETEMIPFLAGCRVIRTAYGRLILHPAFTILHDANLFIVDRLPQGVDLGDLEALVRPIFRREGVTHLRFVAPRSPMLDRLRPALMERKYLRSVYMVMVHRLRSTSNEPDSALTIKKVDGPVGHAVLDLIEDELMREIPMEGRLIRAALRSRRREITEHSPIQWYWSEAEGVPAGSLGVLRMGPVVSIQAVATRPSFRKRHIATTMLCRSIREARESGAHVASLLVEEDNPAIALYSRLGFETEGCIESFILDEDDELEGVKMD